LRAIALAHLGAGATVLDLGCGTGDTVRYLRSQGIDAIGVDRADNSTTPETCSSDIRTRIVARAEALPLADGALAKHGRPPASGGVAVEV
jgi:cyclopropane fatty-acyl-phospholipid synthase-like methyltransferase